MLILKITDSIKKLVLVHVNVSISHDLTYLYLQPSVPCECLSSTAESIIFMSVIIANHEGWRIPEPSVLTFRMKEKMELAWSQMVFIEM